MRSQHPSERKGILVNKQTQHVKHDKHSQPTDAPGWFITGCSTGFGLEQTTQAIERGYRTVMTARDLAKRPGAIASDHVRVLQLDVTQPEQVAAAVKAAEVRKMFDVNVFGLTSMVQAVLRGTPVLGATKFAVEGLSEALRREVEAVARGAEFPIAIA